MASVKPTTTILEYQNFVQQVYGLPNMRNYSVGNLLTNMERFAMRGLKGIRKKDREKTKTNLLISFSWLMSIMNQFHINIEDEIWNRFPYLCSYCGICPCTCKEKKVKKRELFNTKKNTLKPKTLTDFQAMFKRIYPLETRSLEHAGIHLAEELGEFAEGVLTFRGEHKETDFGRIPKEAADYFSCLMGVFNSIDVAVSKELSILFSNNCHVCKNAPCTCSFELVSRFKS